MMLHQNTIGDTFETEKRDLDYMLMMAEDLQVTEHPDLPPVVWDPFVAPGGWSQRYLHGNARTLYASPTYDEATIENIQRIDVVLANPPFSSKQKVLEKLVFEWKKPFVILLPTATLQRKFMRRYLAIGEWEIHIPNRFLRFHIGGVPCPSPPFPSAFYAWKPSRYRRVTVKYLWDYDGEK